MISHDLRHALQVELDEWYQLLAVLEEQRQSELTLLQLVVWSAEPMQRLLLMAQLARSCVHLKGGAMIAAIARHERHGDPMVRGYVRHLLRAAAAPLFGMIRMWVLHGELRDTHDEFFIESRATPLAELWAAKYADQTTPNRTQTEPNRTEPNQSKPNQTEPNRAEPKQTKPLAQVRHPRGDAAELLASAARGAGDHLPVISPDLPRSSHGLPRVTHDLPMISHDLPTISHEPRCCWSHMISHDLPMISP